MLITCLKRELRCNSQPVIASKIGHLLDDPARMAATKKIFAAVRIV